MVKILSDPEDVTLKNRTEESNTQAELEWELELEWLGQVSTAAMSSFAESLF